MCCVVFFSVVSSGCMFLRLSLCLSPVYVLVSRSLVLSLSSLFSSLLSEHFPFIFFDFQSG